MAFITYENSRNLHVTIHREGCGRIAKRGGQHTYGQGVDKTHDSYGEARRYAEGTRRRVIDCSYCSPPVRILPLNLQEFPGCSCSADVQENFFLDELPLREGARFLYKERGLKAEPGTIVLFQCENHLIASAVLSGVEPFEMVDVQGYKGCLYFDAKTIKVFNPVDAHGVRKVWPKFQGFSHVRQSLNPKRYPAFERSLKGVESPGLWLHAEEASDEAPGSDGYSPEEGDSRPLVERQLRERRGQAKFRDALRQRYGDRCLVTGCKVLAVLEAAHIKPFRGAPDHSPENGLLLRADIHTLFDLNLLGIQPENLRLELHPGIKEEYRGAVSKTLLCQERCEPSKEALRRRYQLFLERRKCPSC
jgi:hypothetical protein